MVGDWERREIEAGDLDPYRCPSMPLARLLLGTVDTSGHIWHRRGSLMQKTTGGGSTLDEASQLMAAWRLPMSEGKRDSASGRSLGVFDKGSGRRIDGGAQSE